jgi:protocatechuate 3,4-dioxygenase beta subunit
MPACDTGIFVPGIPKCCTVLDQGALYMQQISRRYLVSAGIMSGLMIAGAATAAARALTPPGTEGPFYPDRLPLDTDNDLVKVGANGKAAAGEVFHLSGRILNRDGTPYTGFVVEIWQCDANGIYLHSGDTGRGRFDPNFQGFGTAVTRANGSYRFRTIKPVSYPGRTPHIHFKVKAPNRREFTSQMYIAGHPGNDSDFLYRRLGGPAAKNAASVALFPAPELEPGAVKGTFDIVLS